MRWLFRKQVASNKEEARRHYNAKDYTKAEPFLLSMLKTDPDDVWALDVLSRLYMNTSRHEEAVEVMHRLIMFNPDQMAFRRAVHTACVADDLQSVMRYTSRIDWEPSDEELLSKIYNSFWPEEACRRFFLDSSWEATVTFPIFVRAQFLIESEEFEEAIALLSTLASPNIVNESNLIFARQICEALGQVDLSTNLWVSYLSQIDGELTKKRSLAKRLRRTNRIDESLQIALLVLAEDPADTAMLELVTDIGYRASSPERSLEAFLKLEAAGFSKLYLIRRYADAAIEAESVSDMVGVIRRLTDIDADATATVRNTYLKLCKLGAHTEAEEILTLIQGSPLEVDLRAAQALEEGDLQKTLDLLETGLREFPDHTSFLMRKGIVFEALGQLDEAIRAFECVLKVDKGHGSAKQRRLNCGMKIWDEVQYEKEITCATKDEPQNINHQLARLNYVLSVKQDYELALEIIGVCLTHHPEHQRSHLYRALILSWLGQHEQARRFIKNSLLRWPTSNDVFITASQIEKNAGNPNMQLHYINALLSLHGLKSIASSSPDLAITPEYLFTQTDKSVEDKRLVSIIMTTYKRDHLLDAAVNSILNQTYQNLELIIVDDNSPDDTLAFLHQLAERDKRIRVFQMGENGGTYVAKNFGMTQAKGEFIGFMDSDDYCHAQRIEYQVASLDAHPKVMGVTHDYFRIDESSDIEFRGIGALRMACISLLIRREVVDEIGFFDSLRVGADSEYIERIEAKFGKECRLRVKIPTMFVMLHPHSLSGGGSFHISWRSITGARLQHHCSFRAWHKKIQSGQASGFVPRMIHLRPYDVPEEMKSTHFEWKDGMPLFSEMIQKRSHNWWRAQKAMWQKNLSAKLAGREFVEQLGLKVPELYWKGNRVEDIPSFESLPPDFVLKPEKGWSSKNVFCMKNHVETLTHTEYTRQDILDKLSDDEFFVTKRPILMIEEMLEPEPKQLDDGLPRDFKFYCFGETIAMVHVALRKSEIHKDQNVHQYYTPEFNIMTDIVMERRRQSFTPISRPDCWDEMIEAVQTIGRSLGIYMRIDMFATSRGAVFGELTPTPHGGKGYSEFADRFLGAYWKGEEGVE